MIMVTLGYAWLEISPKPGVPKRPYFSFSLLPFLLSTTHYQLYLTYKPNYLTQPNLTMESAITQVRANIMSPDEIDATLGIYEPSTHRPPRPVTWFDIS